MAMDPGALAYFDRASCDSVAAMLRVLLIESYLARCMSGKRERSTLSGGCDGAALQRWKIAQVLETIQVALCKR